MCSHLARLRAVSSFLVSTVASELRAEVETIVVECSLTTIVWKLL